MKTFFQLISAFPLRCVSFKVHIRLWFHCLFLLKLCPLPDFLVARAEGNYYEPFFFHFSDSIPLNEPLMALVYSLLDHYNRQHIMWTYLPKQHVEDTQMLWYPKPFWTSFCQMSVQTLIDRQEKHYSCMNGVEGSSCSAQAFWVFHANVNILETHRFQLLLKNKRKLSKPTNQTNQRQQQQQKKKQKKKPKPEQFNGKGWN